MVMLTVADMPPNAPLVVYLGQFLIDPGVLSGPKGQAQFPSSCRTTHPSG